MRTAAALAAAAILTACARSPAGATHRYATGSAEVSVRAVNDRDTFTVDRVVEATYTVNRDLTFELAGARGTLRVVVTGVDRTGSFGANEVFVEVTHAGTSINSRPQGGICDVRIREAEPVRVRGVVSCVGLGAHSGRGYDVGAPFELGAA